MDHVPLVHYVRWIDRQFLYAVAVVLLSCAAYLNSLNGEFVWDDVAQVQHNPFIRELGNVFSFFTVDLGKYTAYPGFSPYYRPLFLISYAVDYSLWGLNPFGFHLTNIALHALCSFLVYVTAVRLLKGGIAPFFAAALFAVHPVHSEAVAWIAGRADLLAALFVFSGLYFYIRFTETGNKLLLTASLLAAGLSLLSKEAAICMPALIIAYEVVFRQSTAKEALVSTLLQSGPFILIAGLYFMMRTIVMGSIVLGHPDAPPITAGRLGTTIVTIFDYLRLFFIPLNLKVLYHLPLRDPFSLVDITFSFLGLFVLGGALILAYTRDKKCFVGALWFLIGILPVLGPAGLVLMADRYLYIPSLGLCLVAGVLLAQLYNSRLMTIRYGAVVIAFTIVTLFLLTLQRNTLWKDEFTYFSQAVEDAPSFAMARNNLGKWHLDRKIYGEAVRLFDEAIALDANYVHALVNRATTYNEMGLHEQAITEYRNAIQKSPRFAEAYYNLGNAYLQLGNTEAAVGQWKAALMVKPEHSGANNNLGNLSLLQGRYAEAAAFYEAALKGQPLNAEAHYNLATALEKLGDWQSALDHYRKFIAIAPEEHRNVVEEIKTKLSSVSTPRK